MAVVCVGSMEDTGTVVQLIHDAFGQGRSGEPGPPTPLPRFGFAPHAEPRFKVFVDKVGVSPPISRRLRTRWVAAAPFQGVCVDQVDFSSSFLKCVCGRGGWQLLHFVVVCMCMSKHI